MSKKVFEDVAIRGSLTVETLAVSGSLSGLTSVGTNNIAFPATQVPSADPNTLDDYEEGSFTPVLDAAVSPTVGYEVQTGQYTKIGDLVHIYYEIKFSSISGGSGALRLGGLPFTVASSRLSNLFILTANHALPTSTAWLVMRANQGQTYMLGKAVVDGAALSNWDLSDLTTTSDTIIVSGSYYI